MAKKDNYRCLGCSKPLSKEGTSCPVCKTKSEELKELIIGFLKESNRQNLKVKLIWSQENRKEFEAKKKRQSLVNMNKTVVSGARGKTGVKITYIANTMKDYKRRVNYLKRLCHIAELPRDTINSFCGLLLNPYHSIDRNSTLIAFKLPFSGIKEELYKLGAPMEFLTKGNLKEDMLYRRE